LREGILNVQISKPEILRKLKQRFGTKTIRDIRFRVG
jgi:hypothetical protein